VKARTLVGRAALLQSALLAGALAAVLALTFLLLTWILRRDWDEGLRAAVGPPLSTLQRHPGRAHDPEWLEDLEDRRPEGARIEVQELGKVLHAVGPGPALLGGQDGCRNQGSWRVCQFTVAGVGVLAGRSREPGLQARRLGLGVMALVALLVAAAASLLARATAARALRPLSAMAERIAAIRPGDGARVGPRPPFIELAALSDRFDDLLARFEETLARERRFAAEASHELRTPLTVLRGEIELLLRGVGRPEEALRAIDELVGLVEGLLWLSRAQTPLDRRALVVVNLADLARAQPASVAAPEEVLVAADEALLARAVANLIENARKHGGGPIELDVASRGEQAVLGVVDHGGGIDPALHEHVFEPFFRGGVARASTAGFGVGLPLARAIARAHGGEVTLVASAPGHTRFELSLPLLGDTFAA
jgi:signal transduction histidine kinase